MPILYSVVLIQIYMSSKKEKIIRAIKKGVREMKLMEAGKLRAQDFGEMMMELKAQRAHYLPGSGRLPPTGT